MASWRHKKRGTIYDIAGVFTLPETVREGSIEHCFLESGRYYRATVQISTTVSNPFYLYVSRTDGKAWLRPRKEFLDGRFEAYHEMHGAVASVPTR